MTVLLYNSIIVLHYYCMTVSRDIVLLYYCIIVLLYYCITALRGPFWGAGAKGLKGP